MTLDTMAGGATVGKAGGGRQQCRELGCDIHLPLFYGKGSGRKIGYVMTSEM